MTRLPTIGPRTRLLVGITLLLFMASLFNDPPWKGYSRSRYVEFNAEPVRIAANLLRNGEFANPFATMSTGPTAHIAPGLPSLQLAILRLCGDGAAGWLALRCLPALALALQFALLPWLARELGCHPWTGVLAAVFGLIVKPGLEDRWEAHIAGLLGLLLTAAACRWQTRHRPFYWAAVVGFLAALSIYFQPVLGAIYGVWILWCGRPFGFLSRRVLPLWLIPLALAAPWMVRGYTALGGIFPLRDNLGLELYVSFNDCAPYGFRESLRTGCLARVHPNSSLGEASAVSTMGEYRYNQDRLRQALAWIGGHPAPAAALVLRRIWFFWLPSDRGWHGYFEQHFRMLALHFLTVFSFVGLYLGLRRGLAGAPLLALWMALFPLIYYAVQFEFRYRYPILWTTWLLAAYVFEPLSKTVIQGAGGFARRGKNRPA